MAFKLPPEISFKKERRCFGWVYLFRHQEIGALGRIVLQQLPGGKTQATCEVLGDPGDPMTEKRAAIFKPLGLELVQQMERIITKGDPTKAQRVIPPSLPPEPPKGIARKLMQCEKCDGNLGLLIFADDARDRGGLEDYARLMYPEMAKLNLPAWVIGAPSGIGPPMQQRSIIMKVWPQREPVFYASPDEFNLLIEKKLRDNHCS